MPDESSSSVRITYPPFSRDELVERLRRGARSLAEELPLRRAVLFGSWAAGRATAYSDIDVLIVYAGEDREDAFKTVRKHIQLRGLEPHVYTEDEAAALDDTLSRMTRNAIAIYPS